jgi:transcriptional regulator
MYVPHFNAMPDVTQARALVASVGAAQLITVGRGGIPLASLLPILWEGDTVVAHMARANQHWTQIDQGAPVLLVVTGAQAYVSPTWYASKADHGRVVPTWNYSAVHLTGRIHVREDPDWLRGAVDALVERHESHRPDPWHSTDAPQRYIAGQLRAIVGLEIRVEGVEGKAKLSQNRSEPDRQGVIEGLRAEPSRESAEVASQMAGQLRASTERLQP